MVSMPCCCSSSSRPAEEKRATPMMRRRVPARSDARLAMRARLGPILPATPSTIRSPSSLPNVCTTSAVGLLSWSSRCSMSWMVSASATGKREMEPTVRIELTTRALRKRCSTN